MSEHRLPSPRRVTDELLHRALHGRCTDWPNCRCGEKWCHWNEVLDQEPVWSEEEIEWVLLDTACMLHCMAKHCPDKRARRHATINLLHPIYLAFRQH